MKATLKIAVISILLLCTSCAQLRLGQRLSNPEIVKPRERVAAPQFTLSRLRGGQFSLSDLKGQIVLIHFWATWCFSCREELPSLERLAKKHKDNDLRVLNVCADRGNVSGIKKAIRHAGVTFPTLLDADGEIRKKYEVSGFPTTYVIGADGKFLSKHVGAVDWESDKYSKYINQLVER